MDADLIAGRGYIDGGIGVGKGTFYVISLVNHHGGINVNGHAVFTHAPACIQLGGIDIHGADLSDDGVWGRSNPDLRIGDIVRFNHVLRAAGGYFVTSRRVIIHYSLYLVPPLAYHDLRCWLWIEEIVYHRLYATAISHLKLTIAIDGGFYLYIVETNHDSLVDFRCGRTEGEL
ncbi:hypothetical protein DSECCO2_577480 [anaerobic digester metagenome]